MSIVTKLRNVVRDYILPGDLKSVTLADQIPRYAGEGRPMARDWSTAEAVEEGFKASHWVYRCINYITRTAATCTWYMEEKQANGEWIRLEKSYGQNLLENPNPFQSGSDLMHRLIMHLYLSGNGIITKIRDKKGKIVELYTCEPDLIYPILDKKNYLKRYELMRPGATKITSYRGTTSLIGGIPVALQDVIHLMFPDPERPWWGFSPVEAARRLIKTDAAAIDWQQKSFLNRAVPEGVFSVKHPQISQEQYDQIKEAISLKLPREPYILAGGTEWEQMSLTSVEMDFIETRKLTREEICGIFGVPPILLGIYEKANYSNAETARKIFWNDTIIPLCDDIQATLNRCVAPELGDNLRFTYDISHIDVLQANLETLSTIAAKFFALGIPLNVINKRLGMGFPEIENGDVGWISGKLVPVSVALEMAEAANQVAELDEDLENEEDDEELFDEEEDEDTDSGAAKEGGSTSAKTEAELKAHWNKTHRHRHKFLKRTQGNLEEVSKRVLIDIVQGIKSSSDIDEIIDQHQKPLENVIRSCWKQVVDSFGNEIATELGGVGIKKHAALMRLTKAARQGGRIKKAKFVFDPSTMDHYIDKQVVKRVTGIQTTTKVLVKRLLGLAQAAQVDLEQAAQSVAGGYTAILSTRAARIAKSEIAVASSAAAYYTAKNSGLPLLRQWVSSKADKARSTHAAVHGEVVGMDETYSNGLLFPGDPDAPLTETENCGCTELYLLVD